MIHRSRRKAGLREVHRLNVRPKLRLGPAFILAESESSSCTKASSPAVVDGRVESAIANVRRIEQCRRLLHHQSAFARERWRI
jgi:hypothetical protein